MIDFLELCIPADAPYGRLFALPGVKPPTRPSSGNYELVQDLTALSTVRIYWNNRFNHANKLRFAGVAKLDAHAILDTIRNVFDVEPLDLKVMRADFAIDLGIGMEWFTEHLTVERKRRKEGLGHGTPFSRWEGTTLYFGKAPSVIRVYDKIAELESRGQTVCEKSSPALNIRLKA